MGCKRTVLRFFLLGWTHAVGRYRNCHRLTALVICLAFSAPAIAETTSNETLSREALETSLHLGTEFLLKNQTPEGNFAYIYDWQAKEYSEQDSPVRQAGAAWGLAAIHAYQPSRRAEAGLHKALDFMNRHSRGSTEGWRYVVYPGEKLGSTGTVALVLLAHLDYLASLPARDETSAKYRSFANEYLRFLRRLRMENGQWHSAYSHLYGNGMRRPSPYFDGEALLAMVKAAKYHGAEELRPDVLASAHAGFQKHVLDALALDPDSPTTKGYYQWGSMAFYELATSGWEGSETFGAYVIDLADWMIDQHQVLRRTRNTAYAYEGIIHAYRLAKLSGDDEHVQKFARVIESGLAKLSSWQVGHPFANAFVLAAGNDPKALGGIQNHRHESMLRIDVTQHQMHAVVLALKYYISNPLASVLEQNRRCP